MKSSKEELHEAQQEEQRRQEGQAKKEEETRRKKEEYKELSNRQKEQRQRAEEAAIKLGKKKGEWYTNPYYIVFGVLGVSFVLIVAMLLLNKAPPLNKTPVIDENKIREHNDFIPWKQGPNTFFEGATLADAKKVINSSFSSHSDLMKCKIEESYIPPTNFDARKQWPNCILPIANQTRKCEASYAFGISQTLAERICINSKEQKLVPLSAQELVSCDKENKGCLGGFLNIALDYVRIHGLAEESCLPYEGKDVECKMCAAPNKEKFDSFCVVFNEEDIKREIAQHGPVIATSQVFLDFLTYRSGVYRKGDDIPKFSGFTTVKIIGWGVEDGSENEPNQGNKYWLIQNSWGEDWGENGVAKVSIGQQFLFEQYAFAVKVKGEVKFEVPKSEEPSIDIPDINLDDDDKKN